MDIGTIFRLVQEAEDFKGLEKRLLQLAFALVHHWMVAVLESLDQELAATREPSLELIRSDVRTLEMVGGSIRFSRRYYRDRATGQCRYLLDEALGLEGRQRRSPFVEQMTIELATMVPYREVERFLQEYLCTQISHQGAHARVQKAGHARVEEQAALQVAMEATGELPPTEGRVVEYLFMEADGLGIALQREGERRTELKLGIAHEGWEEDPPGSGRYRLREKQVFGGLGESRTFWAQASLALHERYALEKVGQILLNGDGASWIQEGVDLFPHAHYQLDRFHLRRHLVQTFGHDRVTLRQVVDGVLAGDWPRTERILAQAAQRSRSPKQRAQIQRLCGYLQANWAGIQDYREALGSVPPGARGLGAIESNIDKIFANRFKKRGMSWRRRGAEHLSQLVVLRTNGRLTAWLDERSRRLFSPALRSAVRTLPRQGRDTQQETGAWLQRRLPALYGPHAGRYWVHILRALQRTSTLLN